MRTLHDMVVLIWAIGLFGKSGYELRGHDSSVENFATSSHAHEPLRTRAFRSWCL